ncbi:hypothetical protein FA95DRAFT_1231439 [Auriscalpium vulgare]|uniref:Uncharacterized protein n=1 Tax=Auriscalpium vulgare TaxID=40419 RepID=A0ACB8RTI5_9AGAM|nr:hypothetical protein FA95DRAFT_1231439 [Auriscalpium vulgare]
MGAGWNDTTKTYGAQFLAAHPFLKSLTWRITFSTDSLDIDGCDPFLPRLQALTTNSSSLLALVVRSQHTPRLRTVHFRGERPLLWTLPLTLRHLSVPEADLAELRKLAHACPALRRLDVGGLGLSKARWRWADIAPWIRMGGPGNVRASVSDALVLFPELRIIGGTRFSSDMRRTKLLERFPRVERFDDLKRASYYWEL